MACAPMPMVSVEDDAEHFSKYESLKHRGNFEEGDLSGWLFLSATQSSMDLNLLQPQDHVETDGFHLDGRFKIGRQLQAGDALNRAFVEFG